MINDRTIDETSAKYWCIFSDKDFKEKILKVDEAIDPLSIFSYTMMGISIFGLLSPLVKNTYKKLISGRSSIIAKVSFIANEKKYLAFFDMKSMKWKLTGRFISNDNELQQFYSTQFFTRFLQQCISYINPFFDNKEILQKNLQKIKDNELRKLIQKILDNEYQIKQNMFTGKISI